MKPDSIEVLLLAVATLMGMGAACRHLRQAEARRAALVKARRKEAPVAIRRSRNWRWF